ncbi:bifunctional diguanylate cyclase/phosphodiesterase [uncultured Bilophila sp.]|uniref:bifunctional diguanylate cyclase/phosphodiesterase n=1 Tax=uncultured Bilophila sp. TaxID=529385 RepID=UPI0025D6E07C|nr:bifunctional diguanylate cyclase/phosphodiesterase [uncultured Bilophila sp.]
MKSKRSRRFLLLAGALALISVLMLVASVTLSKRYKAIRESDAESILLFYRETILLQLQHRFNVAEPLAALLAFAPSCSDCFDRAALDVLRDENVISVILLRGDAVAKVFPPSFRPAYQGKKIKELPYIYTLAKLTKNLLVDGPTTLPDGQPCFLFLQPVFSGDEYLGEVAVAFREEYIHEQLNLESLQGKGYDYELWRISPQTGNKEILTLSRGVDFSHAVRESFYLPNQWTLSIQPVDGWISSFDYAVWFGGCALLGGLLFGIGYALMRIFLLREKLRAASKVDPVTGLYNRTGFIDRLDGWIGSGTEAFGVFLFMISDCQRISRTVDNTQTMAFLRGVPGLFAKYIKNDYLAGVMGDGCFVVAVREGMTAEQMSDLAQGLSLQLLWKVNLNGTKVFLEAQYDYLVYPQGGKTAEELLRNLFSQFYERLQSESPLRSLSEKCRLLVEGQTDVTFNDSSNLDIMQLSMALNQYRSHVEQLAYYDPVYAVGNRIKYLRDVNMLISYNKKRRFSLFCIDISSFSNYNDLFNVQTGDAILREVSERLKGSFGEYIYRISGDVFLGIGFQEEHPEDVAGRLREVLAMPIEAGGSMFTISVNIGVCTYPVHADTPEELLERVQVALRYAKRQGGTVIYNSALMRLLRDEAAILRLLETSLKDGTLEVWYQPLMNLHTGTFTAVEALLRLRDAQGGLLPTDQVIAIAERNGLVVRIGEYVLRRGCSFMRRAGLGLGLSRVGINLSVQHFVVENCTDGILKAIRESGVEPDVVSLEITETVLIQSFDKIKDISMRLQKAGLRIALDDFGAGYSSLNYLSRLPVDVLKIDRGLTGSVMDSPKQHALLKAIVDMARINGMAIVAEGVETAEVRDIVQASGVDYIQGFFYAKPMPEEELILRLSTFQKM